MWAHLHTRWGGGGSYQIVWAVCTSIYQSLLPQMLPILVHTIYVLTKQVQQNWIIDDKLLNRQQPFNWFLWWLLVRGYAVLHIMSVPTGEWGWEMTWVQWPPLTNLKRKVVEGRCIHTSNILLLSPRDAKCTQSCTAGMVATARPWLTPVHDHNKDYVSTAIMKWEWSFNTSSIIQIQWKPWSNLSLHISM